MEEKKDSGIWPVCVKTNKTAAAPAPVAKKVSDHRLSILMSIPAEIRTEPTEKFVFNSPFVKGQKCTLRLVNTGLKRIGFSLKSTNIRRFTFSPTCGALGPWEKTVLDLSCEPMEKYKEKMEKQKERPDRITLEWVIAPENQTEFTREWFAINGLIRRKMINISYNL